MVQFQTFLCVSVTLILQVVMIVFVIVAYQHMQEIPFSEISSLVSKFGAIDFGLFNRLAEQLAAIDLTQMAELTKTLQDVDWVSLREVLDLLQNYNL